MTQPASNMCQCVLPPQCTSPIDAEDLLCKWCHELRDHGHTARQTLTALEADEMHRRWTHYALERQRMQRQAELLRIHINESYGKWIW